MREIIFTVGADSGIGHGQFEEFKLNTTLDKEHLKNIFNHKIKEKLGVDINNLAKEDQDYYIPDDVMMKLSELGFIFDDDRYDTIEFEEKEIDGEMIYSNGLILEPKGFLDIVVFLINKASGNEEDVVFETKVQPIESFHIGGYGVFL